MLGRVPAGVSFSFLGPRAGRSLPVTPIGFLLAFRGSRHCSSHGLLLRGWGVKDERLIRTLVTIGFALSGGNGKIGIVLAGRVGLGCIQIGRYGLRHY